MPWAAAAAVARKDGDSQLGSSEVSGGTNGRESTIDGAHGLPFQMQMRNAYASQPVQLLVAGLIFANFILSAYEKQVLAPEGSPEAKVIYNWEVFFAVAFGIELLCNMYGHWFRAFWGSYGANTRSPLAHGYNWFDLLIVTISFVALSSASMPGVSVLRLFRAFRVFRLFRRVDNLKLILEGVGAAMPGVGNAFVILGILMGIWAIIGVEFFRAYAPEEFGNFLKGMFTMWQVMTMDGWASTIARPLMFGDGLFALAVPFFIAFTFVAGIVMTNVVIAILLEKYLNATADANERKAKERAAARAKRQAERAERAARRRSEGGLIEGLDALSAQQHANGSAKRQPGVLDKERLIDMIQETVKRKNLQSLAKDDVIGIALMVWHHPCLAHAVPGELLVGSHLAAEHLSRSILLNIMRRSGINANSDASLRRGSKWLADATDLQGLGFGGDIAATSIGGGAQTSLDDGPRL